MKQFAKSFSILLLLSLAAFITLRAQTVKRDFIEIRIYTLNDKSQEATVEAYLKDALIPTLHRAGVNNIGVFKPLETDSIYGKRIVVLVPYKTLDQFAKIPQLITVDQKYNEDGKSYLDAHYSSPPYERIETILLSAFRDMTRLQPTALTGPRSERIYELRSYESATENIYRNKVKMFNDGDEVGLFKRLGFNAVFYADVISGSRMPNLMYMTTFANQASHDALWKAFVDDPQWKKLSTMPEYQHNVSKINIYLLRPTSYSDY